MLLPGKSHGQRSLVGCSRWGREESDTTERLHFHFSLSCIGEGNGNPLQRSCLENPRDSGAWWAVVYGVAQSRTRLKWVSNNSSSNVNLVLFHTVRGVLQARILEWVAISFSSGPYVVRILHYDLSILGGLHDMAHGFTELHKLLCQDKADPWRGWPNLGRQWRTEEPGVLQHMGSHSLGHDLVTEQQYSFFSGLPSVIVARQSWQS